DPARRGRVPVDRRSRRRRGEHADRRRPRPAHRHRPHGGRELMDPWINGAERLSSTRSGAAYRTRLPWRFVVHTMEAPEDDPHTSRDEGWSLSQLRHHARTHPTPPHLWAAPKHDWVGQTIPLTRSAYALRHPA